MKYSKVIVQHKSGKKASGKRVSLSISGVFSGGLTANFLTDRNGIAIISHRSSGRARVLVSNISRGEMICLGETVVFI
jgi:hypothetical protein